MLFMMFCVMLAVSSAWAQETKKKSKKETTTFLIENMSCENCIRKIERNIAFEKGVTDLICDLPTRTVRVTYRTDQTNEQKLIAAFAKIDKPARALSDDEIPETVRNRRKR
jgi:Cu2+-exporting ATPase